jgi:Uma2 family endonuclease
MRPATDRVWTAEEVRALPDPPFGAPYQRYEVVDGVLLVSPSPRHAHQRAVGALLVELTLYLRGTPGIGEALLSPSDVELDLRSLVQPDLFVVPSVEARASLDWRALGTPILAIEVLSPSTSRYDRGLKRRKYLASGVPLWLVDIDARLVEVWLPDVATPTIVDELLHWHPDGAVDAFTLDLPAFFLAVTGEP